MNASDLHDRVLGGLAGAVIGDAMGTATETMTRRRVLEAYGRLTTMVAPEHSPFSSGRPAGHFSDDSSQMLNLCARLAPGQPITVDDVVATLLDWAEDTSMFGRTAGPTTRRAIERLRAGEDPAVVGRGEIYAGTGTSNGAAMKAAPAGWLNPGRPADAVRDAITIALPTHATQLAMSGAGAIAAAVAQALAPAADVESIISAALEGAALGEELGLRAGREVAGPSVRRRITEAVRIGQRSDGIWDAMDEISDLIGSGLPTTEAVPAAIGIFAAARGDVSDTIIGAVNLGNDADTVATMAGAIAGTLAGSLKLPAPWIELVTSVNSLDLDATARHLLGQPR